MFATNMWLKFVNHTIMNLFNNQSFLFINNSGTGKEAKLAQEIMQS